MFGQNPKKIESDCALPTITLGWSLTDANQYKNNRATLAGNVKPFLRGGTLSLSICAHLYNTIRCAVESVPIDCRLHVNREEDKTMARIQKEMMDEVQTMLSDKDHRDTSRGNSTWIEGITVLIPIAIGAHWDTNNCGRRGMEAVVQVNARVPANNSTVGSKEESVFRRWLQSNRYSSHFPCSIILYSRKCVASISVKKAKMVKFCNTNTLQKLLGWALVDRVGSVMKISA